jgi:hypothetical protein
LTVAEELKKFGFSVQDKYFYNFFGVPPVIQNRHPAIHQRITRHFEVDNAKAWQGHFMANAFLVSCTCDDL